MRAVDCAAEAAIAGSETQRRVAAGLATYGLRDVRRMANPTSGRNDGVTPSRTAVVMAEDADGKRMCVKLYDGSEQATEFLKMHVKCLTALCGVVPVPEITGIERTTARFGLRALVTSHLGEPFDHVVSGLPTAARTRVAEQLADALVVVSRLDLSASELGIPTNDQLRHALLQRFAKDAAWYVEHAPSAPSSARALVLHGAELLASADLSVNTATLCHSDLVASNILIRDGALSGIVDWDYAEVAPPELDLGSCMLGLLVSLPVGREERLRLLEIVLQRYAHRLGYQENTVMHAALPFALDALLDWTIDGKNAPLDDFVWALLGLITAIEKHVPLSEAFR